MIQAVAEAKGLTKIDLQALIQNGLISNKALVKVLGNGALTMKLEIEAHAFSKSAEEAITAAGGTVTKLSK